MKKIQPWLVIGLTVMLLLSGFTVMIVRSEEKMDLDVGRVSDPIKEKRENAPEIEEFSFEEVASSPEDHTIGSRALHSDNEEQWRWLYDHEHRTESENAVGLTEEATWYGGIMLDLSEDIDGVITEVAYYDFEEAGDSVQAHVAEEDNGAPGSWIASSELYSPTGAGWVELELDSPVLIEEPGDYWVVMEIDDFGEDNFPFGCISPYVMDGQYINIDDPENPNDWDDLREDGIGGAWSLEARVETVETLPADEINSGTVTLNGELKSDSAEVFFRYKKRDATAWFETTPVQVGSGEFSDTITGLDPLEEYEFKAVAEFEGEEVEGDPLYFIPAHVSRTTQTHEEWEEYISIGNLQVEEHDLRLDTEEEWEDSYGYEGESETVDLSSISEIEVEMSGAGGGGGAEEEGGDGGYLNAFMDVSDFNELEIWVGERGYHNNSGGWGRSDGGDGGYNAGGGGGSSEIWADGTFLAAADAGGGGSENWVWETDFYGGGGGARGGEGGYGSSSSGDDAEGEGYGGDGGASGLDYSYPGSPGVGEVNPDHVIGLPDLIRGGGSSGGSTWDHGDHGSIEISYLKNLDEGERISEPLSLDGIEETEDSLITWGSSVPHNTDITVYTAVTESESPPSDWDHAMDDDTIPSIEKGDNLTGKYLWTRQVLNTADGAVTPRLHDLTVAVMGAQVEMFELTVEAEEGGTTYPSPGTYTYDEDAEVTVQGIPEEDWIFNNWTGDVPPGEEEDKEITLVMDEDKSLIANFSIQEFDLTIESTDGGEVIEPGEGTFPYARNEEVDLKAVAEEHHHFVEWTGDLENVEDPSKNSTSIEILDNHTLTANFAVETYTLSINSTEGGNVTEPGEETFYFDALKNVTLEASADDGYAFIEWSGDVDGIQNPKSKETIVEMKGNYSITAEFDSDFRELIIDSSDGGSTDPESGTYFYRNGTDTEVEAIPNYGWNFVNWTGDYTGTEKEITITMDENISITANFEKIIYDLTINSTDGGTVSEPGEDTFSYEYGMEIELEAVAEDDHHFVQWLGDTGGVDDTKSNVTTVEMLDNYELIAYFSIDTYDLTIDSTDGGEVKEPGEDNFTYDHGTEVELEAVSDPGYHFVEWTGDIDNIDEPGSNHTTIVIEDDHEITAEFSLDTYELTVGSTEGGEVKEPGEEAYEYDAFEEVVLEAAPEENYHFVEWTGDIENIEDPESNHTTIVIEDDHEITAEFALDTYDLTVGSTEGGEVTEPGEDTFTYDHGTSVDLRAVAEENHQFVHWTGDVENIENPESEDTTITMESDYEIIADFSADQHELEMDIVGEGDVNLEPDHERYDHGTEVTISAEPDEGWYFDEWTGHYTGTEEEITITMDQDKDITAHFKHYVNLTLEEIEGEGTVFIDGDEADTGFTRYYEQTKVVELAVDASEGWTFMQWKGDVPAGEEKEEEITIDMDEDRVVTAVFIEEFDLTLEVAGEGTTEPEPGTYTHTDGDEVELHASPEEGWYFSEWDGDHEDTEKMITVTMDTDKHIIARFEEIEDHLLTIEVEGEGSTEPEQGRHTYEDGRDVGIVATPEDGWSFSGWDEDHEDTEKMITVTMDSDKHVIARFEERVSDLTIEVEGEGITEPEEGTHTYEEGADITVTAIPEEGWYFVEWTGDNESLEKEFTITMDRDKQITAHFEKFEVEILSPTDGVIFAEDEVTVEWYSQGADYHEIRLNEDDWTDIGMETSYTFEDLEEGNHEVGVRIVDDEVGVVDVQNLTFVVDLTPPELNIISPRDGEKIGETEVEVEWDGTDELSGIDSYRIRLDQEEWVEVGTNTVHTFEDLEEGTYTLEVKAEDAAGNEATETINFTVEVDDDETLFAGLSSVWWILLLVLLIFIPIFLLLFWKREEEEQEEEGDILGDIQELEKAGSEYVEESSTSPPDEELPLDEIIEGKDEFSETEDEEKIEAEDKDKDKEEDEFDDTESGSIEEESVDDKETTAFEQPDRETKIEDDKDEDGKLETGIEDDIEAEIDEELKMEEEEDEEVFQECEECGFLTTTSEEKCPYCEAPIPKSGSDSESKSKSKKEDKQQ